MALADDPSASPAHAGKHLVWTMAPDGRRLGDAPVWCAFTGQSPDATRGEGWTEAVHPDDRAALLRTIAAGVASEQPYEAECRLRRADGVWRQMAVHGTPVHAADGRLREWVGVCTDVSEERERLAAREDALAQERAVVRQQRTVLRRLYAALRGEHEVVRLEHDALQGEHDAVAAARQARDALRASEARFQRLVAGNLIGVVVAEAERITEANDAFLRLLGYTRVDLEAGRLCWREMTPSEYAARDAQALTEVVERGECTPYEKEYQRADGTRVPVFIGATLLAREPLQWVCFVVDLTERQRLEAAVRVQARQLEATFAALGDAVILTDLDGRILQANAAYQALYGLPAQAQDLQMSAEERARLLQVRSLDGSPLASDGLPLHRLSHGETYPSAQPLEMQVRTLDGRDLVVSVTGGPVRDDAGQVVGIAMAIRDVSERQRLERELAERAGLLETTFEALADGLVVVDGQGRIVRTNRAFRTLHGLEEASDFVSLPAVERARLVIARHPDGSPLSPDEMPSTRVLRADLGPLSAPMDVVITNLAGREITLSVSGGPIVDATGQVLGGVALYRDVSEQRRLERERRELMGLVAHDLANPLTTLKAHLQLLQRRAVRGEAAADQSVGPLAAAVRRMERLVGDLRAHESLETGHLTLVQQPCDLAQLCREEADAAGTASGRAITLTVPDSPVMAHVDRDRIGQVLGNLLSNALKYSPSGRLVVLALTTEEAASKQGKKTESKQAHARVTVRDEGPGIPPTSRRHLFERFYRVPGIEVQHGPGRSLGLGLYICRQLVERHGGQMGVESTVGEGSTFWFTLPLAQTDEQERPHAKH